jgi:hypothetical protein
MHCHAAECVHRTNGLVVATMAWPGQPAPAGRGLPALSVGDGFPDQLGDIDDEIRSFLIGIAGRAYLADTGADGVVQPAIGLAVGQVKYRPDDLTAPWRIRAAIPMPLKHDGGSIVGLDDGTKVWPERAGRTVPLGKVRPTEAPGYRTLTAPLGDKEQLLPAAIQADAPALGIAEADAIELLKPHQLLLQKTSAPTCWLARS